MRLTPAKIFVCIAGIIFFTGALLVPAPIQAAETTYTENAAAGNNANALAMINCGGWILNLNVDCFAAKITYYVFYMPAMGALAVSGYILDFILALSIDKAFITQDFVGKVWSVVRDFTNMTFIFILLYAGIQTIFGMGNWKNTILQVVILALLVNFSMFFTKIVIDAGNILAVGIYTGVGTEKSTTIDRIHKKSGSVKEHNISASLIAGLKPQQFMSLSANNKAFAPTIFIIAGIVSLYAAFIFIKASFLFIGRLIAFWFLMIISPFALASMAFPKANIWEWWTSTLISQAFVAPVFLFLIYLIMAAIGGIDNGGKILDAFGEPSGAGGFFDIVVIPVVVTSMIVYALQYAYNITKGMSGKFGDIGAEIGGKVMGTALGVATGGASIAGRAVIGQGASKLLATGALQRAASSESKFMRFTGLSTLARGGKIIAEETTKSSFDLKSVGLVKKAMGDIGKGGYLTKEIGKGGYVADNKRMEKKDTETAKSMEVTDSEKHARMVKMYPEYTEATARVEKEYQEERTATFAHKEAEANANNTKEKRDVDAKKEVVATTTSSFNAADAELVKKINDLKKRQAESTVVGAEEYLQSKIDEVEDQRKAEKKKVEDAERELKSAEEAFAKTAEAIALKSAEENKKKTADTLAKTRKIIKETKKDLEDWEQSENERRREVSGRASTLPHFYYTKADRNAAVKNIRAEKAKKTKKQKEEDEDNENIAKVVKKVVEKTLKGNEPAKKEDGAGEKKEEVDLQNAT